MNNINELTAKLEAIAQHAESGWQEAHEQEARAEAAEKRNAELEQSELQLMEERDSAEEALADMYQAATGERPEWSNWFGYADAVDAVTDRVAELEANQITTTGTQFLSEAIGAHAYIAGCLVQGRPDLALEEAHKWVSVFSGVAAGINLETGGE